MFAIYVTAWVHHNFLFLKQVATDVVKVVDQILNVAVEIIIMSNASSR